MGWRTSGSPHTSGPAGPFAARSPGTISTSRPGAGPLPRCSPGWWSLGLRRRASPALAWAPGAGRTHAYHQRAWSGDPAHRQAERLFRICFRSLRCASGPGVLHVDAGQRAGGCNTRGFLALIADDGRVRVRWLSLVAALPPARPGPRGLPRTLGKPSPGAGSPGCLGFQEFA
jgi:hypothetical protein